ncbi:hypothetical protein EON65_34610, partial [archaeon]
MVLLKTTLRSSHQFSLQRSTFDACHACFNLHTASKSAHFDRIGIATCMMASVNPTIRKRIARSILEVGGCVVFWSLTDGMENAEVSTRVDLQGQSLTSKIQNCSFQGKSMFAEYRMLYNKISMKCEGEVKTVTKSKSITQADMNEFFDNVAPINIRTVLPPAWFASSLNASAAEFKKQYATVTPEEEAGMTSFVRHGHKPPLVDLLDLIVLKAKNEEALNKHFSYYMGTLLLRVKSMYGSRMSSQEAFDCEVYKTGYTLFLSALWLKITQSAFRNHFLEFDKPVIRNVLKSNYAVSVLLTCCYIFCLGKIRMGITDVLSTGPVTSQIGQIVHSIKQEDLAASDEGDQTDSASVDKVKLMKWVLFSFFKSSPVPSGGTPEEPINMRNVGIYAIIRPINELVVFSIMLPLSLGLYVWRPAAAVLPAFAVSTKKCFRIDDDVFCHSRDLPMLETFINNVLTFTFATSLYASTSNLVYPLIFIITTHMEEVIKWFRSCDHLLRPNWSFILDVRYLLETLTYYKYLAFKRGGSPPTEEMRSFAEAMAEIYSTDYWNEKKSKKMSVKDLEAVTVGLEYYFEKHHGVTKDKAGPFTLVYIVLDWLFHDPSNKKVGSSLPLDVLKLLDEDYTAHQAHQIELNQVYFDAKTDFFNRLAGPTGLDMDGFTD